MEGVEKGKTSVFPSAREIRSRGSRTQGYYVSIPLIAADENRHIGEQSYIIYMHKVQHIRKFKFSCTCSRATRFSCGSRKDHQNSPAQRSLVLQKQLNTLAKLPAFQRILANQVSKRKLVMRDVSVAGRVAKRAHGNREVINQQNFGPNEQLELAALVSFFRLQSQWPNSLQWKVVGQLKNINFFYLIPDNNHH